MKKHLFLFLMLALIGLPGALRAEQVTIGDESSTNSSYLMPVNMNFNYSMTQQIYTAEEINMPQGGTITSISLEYVYSGSFSLSGVQVYMKNISKSDFENNNDWVEVSETDKVWQGTFAASGAGWVTLNLNSVFHYDGTSNLLVCFYKPTTGYPGTVYKFRTTSTSTDYPDQYLALTCNHDEYIPDLNNIYSYSGAKGLQTFRTNIRLNINPDITEVYINDFTIPAWEENPDYDWSEPSGVNYYINANSIWKDETLGSTLYPGNIFNQEGHDYVATFYFSCIFGYHFSDNATVYLNGDPLLIDEWGTDETGHFARTIPFHVHPGYTVNDGSAASEFIPVYGYWADTYLKTEFVMPSSSLADLSNTDITGMTFYSTSDYQNVSWSGAHFLVFMKEVGNTTIDSYNGYSNATVVYEGDLSIVDGKMSIPFTTPYAYSGGNLLVGVYNTVSGGGYANCAWMGAESSGTTIWGYDDEYTSLDNVPVYTGNFLPKTTFSYEISHIDFENKDVSDYDFANDATYPWIRVDAANGCDNGSAYCMRSGNAGVANSTSTIEITHIYSASGSISFNAKCMGEGTSTLWDHCDFFIDGVQQFSHGADVSGWNNYLFTVTAGAHTFTWSYSKDSSVDNPGDGFFVDNIIFHLGDPCISPSAITVSTTLDGDANFSWNGISSSYALRYRPEGSGAWTTVTGITDQNYTISGLTPGLYNVQVAAECDPENWVSGSFTIMEILSTANWYGYADYTFDGEDWEGKFISFTMQDPSTVTAATSSTVTETFAAAYANGYVWAITTSGDLLRATLDNSNKTISDFETVVSGFESGTAIDMSYNPVDGKMYYIAGSSLKSFHPNLPETITEIGTLDNTLMTLAINSSGVAYGVEYSTGNLYQVNLTNATPTLVNNTGQNCSFVQSMAFDLTTGELFWAQIFSSSDVGLYKVDPATAETVFMGQIGGGSGVELTGLFMGDDNQMACLAPTGLTVSEVGPSSATLSWTGPTDGYEWEYQYSTSNDFSSDNISDFVNGTTVQLTGLTAETTYYVRVRTVCGTMGNSFWTAIKSFTTTELCTTPSDIEATHITTSSAELTWTGFGDQYAVRYGQPVFSDDFENGLGNWTLVDADGDGHNWFDMATMGGLYPSYASLTLSGWAYGGSNAALSGSYINDVGVLSPDNWLVSPQLPLGGAVSFWARGVDASYAGEHFAIYVSTTGTNPSDFTQVSPEFVATGTYTEYSADLSAYAGQQGYVAIRNFNINDMYILAVDNVLITGDPSSWTTVITTDASVVLNGLTPGTTYGVQVQSDCGSDGISAWSNTETFTTTESTCIAPTNLTVSSISYNGAELTWDQPGSGYDWRIEYSTSPDFSSATSDYSYDTYWSLTELYPITTYYVRVANDCGTMGNSEWATTSFTTTGGVIIIPDIIDFETLDISDYDFVNDATYPWIRVDAANGCDNGSAFCMMSGNAGVASSTSTIEITHDYSADGYITFDAKCMGEEGGYDFCEFLIDGAQQFAHSTDISGWNPYAFEVTTGTHTFTWKYTKDSSVDPTGDGFFVDNIEFGTGEPCVSPFNLAAVSAVDGSSAVSWGGYSSSYTLRYRPEGDAWTTVTGITDATYTITGLSLGNYEVEVSASCNPDNWTSTTFSIMEVFSTANWYGFALEETDGEPWENQFIHFTMQDPATVTQATSDLASYYTFAAAYADGYVWCINQSEELVKAELDNTNHTISSFETVISSMDECDAMSYNPVDGKMYYVKPYNYVNVLMSFDLNDPGNTLTTVGAFNSTHYIYALAINQYGAAYGIDEVGNLYQLNLSDASCTLIGNTGLGSGYIQALAFDLETDELFWSERHNYDVGLYKVDPATARVTFIGQVGGGDGCQLVGLFMGGDATPICPAPTNLYVDGLTSDNAILHWTENGSATAWSVRFATTVDFSDEVYYDATTQSYDFSHSLTPGTTYYVEVQSSCEGGLSSVFSSVLTFTTPSGTTDPLVEIGSCSTGNSYLPSYSYYSYSLTQQIYTAAEVGQAGDISSVAFYNNGSTKIRIYDVYLVHTDKSAFTGSTDWVPVTAADRVFSGAVNMEAGGWTTLEFDNMFHYNGTQNLLLVVDDNTDSYSSGMSCFAFDAESQALRIYSDGIDYDPYDPSTYTGTLMNVKNCVQFTFGPILCHKPTNLTVSNIGKTSATLNWTENGTATEWQVCVNGDEAGAITVTTTPFTLTGLTTETEYTVKVRANCGGSDGVSAWSEIKTFTTLPSCFAPTNLTVSNVTQNTAILEWTENDEATEWEICVNGDEAHVVTASTNPYTLTGLTPGTENTVKVRANCGGSDGVSAWSNVQTFFTISDIPILSTANWYGYATYSLDGQDWDNKFISFSMQDPAMVSAATSTTLPTTYAAAYADGYVWFITQGGGNLCRTTLDNVQKTINVAYVTVVQGFESNSARTMAYNPADGYFYYINGNDELLRFAPADPNQMVSVGTLSEILMTLAINASGEAYGIENGTGALYQIDLTNATATLVGNTGQNCNYVQDMAFDLTTGELFWAQIYSTTDVGLYKVDPATAETYYLGQVGGGSGAEITGLFMGYDYEITCLAPSNLAVSNVGPTSAELSWTENGTATDWTYQLSTDPTFPTEMTEELNIADNPYPLTGLTPETTYWVRVSAHCGSENGESLWSPGMSFTTTVVCPAPYDIEVTNITTNSAELTWTGFGDEYTVQYGPVLFFDDFENGLGQWTQIDADGDGFGWMLGSEWLSGDFAHSGTDIVLSQSYISGPGALTPDNYLVTPQITLGGMVEFWAKPHVPSWPEEHFGIAVSTAGNTDASDFTTIAEWTLADGDWQQYTVDLSAYAGQQGYVALRHFDCTDMFYLYIDDFVILGDHSSWISVTTTDAHVVLNGLTPGTTYGVEIQSDCGSEGMSEWSSVAMFTTTASAPSDIIDFETQDVSDYDFVNDATYPWIRVDAANGCDNGSAYCMRSGNAGVPSSTSTIEITHNYSADGYITFDAKCMGEGTSYDVCEFYIDGAQQFTHGSDLSGWNLYVFEVTAGSHTFTWTYSKDNSVNNPGDGFFVDNIEFGTGDLCVSPSHLAVSTTIDGSAAISWSGYGSGYTLRYRHEGDAWTTVTGITDLTYTFTGLPVGNYEVGVAPDCNPTNFTTTTFTIVEVLSTANWYSYAPYSMDGEDWEDKFISFSMQDPSTVTAATSTTMPNTYAAAYADGYVWFITESEGDLCRTTLDNVQKTINVAYVTVVQGFESNTARTMAYNPADGYFYYINGNQELLRFAPANPNQVVSVGTMSETIMTLAINAAGEAYGVELTTGDLYQIDLTNSTTTLVGNTGQNCNFVQDMAFDLTTGELFWAQISSTTDVGLYKVDPVTAETVFLGQVGGGGGAEITGLFMGDDYVITCPAPSDLTVSNVEAYQATVSWDEDSSVDHWVMEYGTDADFTGASTLNLNTAGYLFDNLTPETTYYVRVKADCGSLDGESYWSSRSFTTLVACPAPSDLIASNVGPHTADLSWTENGTATDWTFQISTDPAFSTEMTQEFNTADNSYPLTGLVTETTYWVRVSAYCGSENGESVWSSVMSFTTTGACPAPYNLTTSSITGTSATIDWTGFGDQYSVRYMPILFFDDFEDGLGKWTQIDADGDGNGWRMASEIISNSDIHGGLEAAISESYRNSYGALYPDNYLITPQTSLGGMVEFWAKAQDPGWPAEHFGIAVSTTGNTDASDFTTIAEWTLADGDWQQYTVDLSAYAGQQGYVALRHFDCSDQYILVIDDFIITDGSSSWTTVTTADASVVLNGLTTETSYEVQVQSECSIYGTSEWSSPVCFTTSAVSCLAPSDLTVTNVTKHSVELSWTENGTATEWQIILNNDDATIIDVTTNPYILEGLDAETEYTVQVRAICGSDWSDEVTFTTEIGCAATEDLTVMDVTYNSATFTWTGEGSSFNLRFRALGDEWVLVEDILPVFTLEDLMPSTDYEVQVQNNCGTEGLSEWSNMATFTTLMCPVPSDLTVTNVTKHSAELSWTENSTATEWQIIVNNDDANIIDVTTNPYILEGLDAETEYTVQVRANCGSDWSEWSSETTFTTEIGCAATEDLTVMDVSYNDASLNWTGEGTSFNLRYRTPGDEWVLVEDVLPAYTLEELMPGTDYEVQVQNNCGTEGLSEWSNMVTFTTMMCPIPSELIVTNVTKNSAELSWTENGTATEWQITVNYDDANIITVNTNPYILEGLVAGTDYIVQVQANCGGIWSDWSIEAIFTTEPSFVPTYANIEGDNTVCPGNTVELTAYTDVEVTYLWSNGETTQEILVGPGIYSVTVTSTTGEEFASDEFVVTEKESYAVEESRSICPSELPYEWNGVTFSAASTLDATLTAANGCDSVVTMTLTVKPTFETSVLASFCEGGSYNFFGTTLTEAGTYTHTLTSTVGCDSTIVLTLSMNPIYNTPVEAEICEGGNYIFFDQILTTEGVYTHTLQTVAGCDSVITLTLAVNPTYNTPVAVEICEGSSYDFFGQTLTTEGVYTHTLESQAGCDSVITLTLTVKPTYNTPVAATICQGESYDFFGDMLTTADIYTHTLEAANGCDSVITLTLTVNPTYEVAETRDVCPAGLPYTWNGVTFTAAGTQTATLPTVNGCDSVVTMTLTVSDAYTITENRVVCENELPVTWNGYTFTAAGTHDVTLTAANGCDSVVTMVLTVNPTYAVTDTKTVCASELPYTWNDVTFTEAGTQTVTLPTVNGCDSVVTMTLTVNPIAESTEAMAVCQNELPYSWNGVTFTEAGTQTATLEAANGCDSIVTMTLTVKPTYAVTEKRSVCITQLPYEWNGVTFTSSSVQNVTLEAENGCDSVVTMILTVTYPQTTNDTRTICQSELPYEWNGVTFLTAGTQYAIFEGSNGCDSTVAMTLLVNPVYNTPVAAEICQGSSYEFFDQTLTTGGTYTHTLEAANGCDSTITLTLTVNTPVHTATTAESCGSYTWNGETYTVSGDYEYAHTDIHGCTQVDTLHLTINNPVHTAVTAESCGSYTWNEQTYTETGVYTYTHEDEHGCTQVDTLHLTINNPVHTAVTAESCGSFLWNEQTYTETGVYTYSHEDANGCTQVDTLHLTIFTPVHTAITAESCGSYTWTSGNNLTYTASGDYTYSHLDANGCTQVDTLHLTILQGSSAVVMNTICAEELPYEWNGVVFNQAGMQTATIEAVNGCDSVVTMVLMVNTPMHHAYTAQNCGSYTWNGQTFTASGDYTYSHTDANGCTQVDTLHLTIFTPVNTAVTVSECGSYTWAANGQTYTASGDYTYSHADVNGCTQVDTLHLTIHNPVHTAITVSECGSYTWAANGQTYTASGDYTYSHADLNGCTQVDTLHLTINNPVNTVLTVSECGSYTWAANGQTYTASGDYTYSHTDVHGCTQVDTLHLTIFNPVHTAVTAESCGSYTWTANGQTYTASGDYTYSHTDANGCTQVDTLHLTILVPAQNDLYETACGSYTWNGQSYTTSGNYSVTYTAANGCDSVVTLHLTINQSVQSDLYETACDSYTWNGTTYTQSNDYAMTFTAANGCDSLVVLHLTINQSVQNDITAESCDSYTWNGQSYTASGDYTTTFTAANGCDSVVTLHLTIHQSTASEFTIETPDSCYTWNGQTYCASGDYVQTLQTVNGCDSVVTLHLTTSVGVENHEVSIVFLAPNPTKNICRIMGLETDPVSVNVFDMRGKLVLRDDDTELDVSMLPTGMYTVRVNTGDRVVNLKLIKQ